MSKYDLADEANSADPVHTALYTQHLCLNVLPKN